MHFVSQGVGRWDGVDEGAKGYPGFSGSVRLMQLQSNYKPELFRFEAPLGLEDPFPSSFTKLLAGLRAASKRTHTGVFAGLLHCVVACLPGRRAKGQGETPQRGRQSARNGRLSLF